MSSSKIIVYGLELQAALKAVLAVAPNTDYDLVQFRVQAAGGNLLVGARDPKNNLVVGITVGTTMVDIVHGHDEVIEISKASAVQILAKKVKADDDQEDPLVGLIITDDRVTCTDETGLDLGLRLTRVRRLHFDGGPWLGDIEDMLAAASDSLPGESSALSPTQWKKVAAVANAVGLDLEVCPLQPSDTGMYRSLIVGDRVAGYAAHSPRRDDDTPEPVGAVSVGTFQEALDAALVDTGVKATVNVVSANPPRGSA